MKGEKNVWTVGHSTRTIGEFLDLLISFRIATLVDVRTFPGSRKYPHFNKENLSVTLNSNEITYVHMPALGGRRKPAPESTNTAWRNASFRGYADYMETDSFRDAIIALESLASKSRVAYMCSEAVWWRCHRALISDYLKVRGWNVCHIMQEGKCSEHPYTSPARTKQGKLFY